MTILALLFGLTVSHLLPDLARLRQYRWLLLAIDAIDRALGRREWSRLAAVIAVPVISAAAVSALVGALAGTLGLLLLGVATVVYCLGPRDLDHDVASVLDDQRPPATRQIAMESLQLSPETRGPAAAAAALHASLARWFGILFWFALLGIAGALLYRTARIGLQDQQVQESQRELLQRLLDILNWPVLVLMALSMALIADFEKVWHFFRKIGDHWSLHAGVLDELAELLCAPDTDLETGLAEGWMVTRRLLWLWLAVLSVLLLVGWLS